MHPRAVVTMAFALLVLPAAMLTPAVADPERPGMRGVERAARALAEARALFDGRADQDSGGARLAGATRRDATLVLRDLALSLDDLDTEDRASAERILARPTDDGDPLFTGYKTKATSDCESGPVCLHWVTSTDDATEPAWVTQTGTVLAEVWRKVVGDLGYRTPLTDDHLEQHGPDEKLDVYLADLGDLEGLYGYCVPEPAGDDVYYASGYCVLDNDYSPDQYAGASPLADLQVTAAHELFHAVQIGYDLTEDAWLMEGTAAWVEDQVYDDVNDNLQFLTVSALSTPWLPLDLISAEVPPYGAWVFWQFLAEYVGTSTEANPDVIRAVWERADATPGRPDDYSAQAVRNVLASYGTSFKKAFRMFGVVNRVPTRWYFEGASFPTAPLTRSFTLTKDRPASGTWSSTMDHLTTDYYQFRPGRTLTGPHRLKVTIDMPRPARGSAATLMVHRKTGGLVLKPVGLASNGEATARVPFSRSEVSAVELVLTNASVRYRDCWKAWGQPWAVSCFGYPRDDNLLTTFSAKAVQG